MRNGRIHAFPKIWTKTFRGSGRDTAINDLSQTEERIVVTKDADFCYPHVLHGKPYKLVLIRTGNLGKRELLTLFAKHLEDTVELLQGNTLVELDRVDEKAVR